MASPAQPLPQPAADAAAVSRPLAAPPPQMPSLAAKPGKLASGALPHRQHALGSVRADARQQRHAASCAVRTAARAGSRLGSLAEAAVMEAMRLSLSLAACDVAVVDAQTEIDLSLAASAEAEAEADADADLSGMADGSRGADSRERAGAGSSTGLNVGLSSLKSVNEATLPGAHGATPAHVNGLGGVGMGAGLHPQAQPLESTHTSAQENLPDHIPHYAGRHHVGSSRAHQEGLESSAHLGSRASGQPWELQLESAALSGFTGSSGAGGVSPAEPAPQWKAVRERDLEMGHPGRRSSAHSQGIGRRGDRAGAKGLGPGGRSGGGQSESRAQREKEAAFLGEVLAVVEGRSTGRGLAASAESSSEDNGTAAESQAVRGSRLVEAEAREQELRAVLSAWGPEGNVGRAELSNVIKALGRRGHTAWALAVFQWMSEQGTVDVSAQATASEGGCDPASYVGGALNGHMSANGAGAPHAGTGHAVNGHSVLEAESAVPDHSADRAAGRLGFSALPRQPSGVAQSPPALPHAAEGAHGVSRAAALRPNGHTFSLILGILGRAGKVKEAEEVFRVFRGMGFRDKVHGFNAMLAAYMRQGQGTKAWALFEEMMQAPTAPVMHGSRRESTRSPEGEGRPLALSSAGADPSELEPHVRARGANSGYPHAPGEHSHQGSHPSAPHTMSATGDSAVHGARASVPASPAVQAADRVASPESSWTAQNSLASVGLGGSPINGLAAGSPSRSMGSPLSSALGSKSVGSASATHQPGGWGAVSGAGGAEGPSPSGEGPGEEEGVVGAEGDEAGLHLRRPSAQNSVWHTGGMPGPSGTGGGASAAGPAPAPDVVSFNTMIGACMPKLHTTHQQPRQPHRIVQQQQQVLQQSEGIPAQALDVPDSSQGPSALAGLVGSAGLHGPAVPSRAAAGAAAVAAAPVAPEGVRKGPVVATDSQGLAGRPVHQGHEGGRAAAGTGRGGVEAWGTPGPRVAVTSRGGEEDGSEKALWLFFEMQRRRLRPSTRTFNALLGVLGREQRWHHMDAILASMEEHHQQPDMFTYNILISSHCRARRLSDALRYYAEALAQGLQPTDVTLSALMAGYAAAGRTREALAAFQQLERQQQCQGLRPDTTAFCGLMAVYKEAGRADDAERTFRRMIAEGAKPNTVAFSCLIHAFGREGRLEDAARVFEEMLGAPESACQPDVQAFNILMAAFGQQGLSTQASRLFRRMQSHGLTPDIVSYNTLIQAFVLAAQPKQAEQALAHMLTQSSCRPNSVTKGLLLRAYNDAGWHAKAEELRRSQKPWRKQHAASALA